MLREVGRVLDRLDALDAVIVRDGATTFGSTGQTVVHPALTEARGQQVVLHRLLSALQLDQDDASVSVPSPATLRARKAAAVRWQPHRDAQDRRKLILRGAAGA